MNLKIKDILNCTNGKLIIGNENYECTNYSKDTRTINEHDTYIGIKGENFDGNLFWKDALDKGADVVIVNEIKILEEEKEKYKQKNKNIIMVEDTVIALGKMAKLKREMYGKSLKVIGVTGSVGKTSTKDMLANVISQKYKTLKTEGNYNNNIGLPLTILRLQDEEVAVIEMGMNHLGEISYLSKIAKPDISVITNVGTAHIGNLGSRENILKAKLEILEGAKENAPLIINNDNDMLNNWYQNNNVSNPIITFGIENKSDIMAENIELNENGSTYILVGADASVCPINVFVPIGGKHFVYNSLCAIAVGKYFDIEINKIIDGIKEFELTKRRMEVTKNTIGATIINDAYNASYDSMKASIEYMAKITGNKKIAVLGDMLELGKFEKELHEKVGEEVAKNKIDILITVGKAAKHIAKKAEELGMKKENIYEFETNNEAAEKIKQIIKKDDVILIKASNGMKFDEIVKQII